LNYRCEQCKQDTPCIHTQRSAGWTGEKESVRMKYYSDFMHEGDFEKWQPACYMDHSSSGYLDSLLECEREYVRALWILSRHTTYYNHDWFANFYRLDFEYEVLKRMIDWREKRDFGDNVGSGEGLH